MEIKLYDALSRVVIDDRVWPQNTESYVYCILSLRMHYKNNMKT